MNRIQEINSKYLHNSSSNDFLPPVEFRESITRPSNINTQIMHPTITHENPRYLNSLTANPIGAQYMSHYKHSRVETVTQAINKSRVVVTHNPPIVQATSTPTRIYQIVQPIIEVTPGKITTTRVEKEVSNIRPIEVSRKIEQEIDIPSPPPIGQRRKAKGFSNNKGCCQKLCGCNCCGSCPSCSQFVRCQCCSSWLCLLIFCLVFLPLVGLMVYALTNPKYGRGDGKTILQELFSSKNTSETIPITFENNNSSNLNQSVGIDQSKYLSNNKTVDPPLTSEAPPPFNNTNVVNKQIITITNVTCPTGYFLYKSKCLSCPTPSIWNGTNCIKYIIDKINAVSNTSSKIQRSTVSNISSGGNNIYVADAWSVVQPKQHISISHLRSKY